MEVLKRCYSEKLAWIKAHESEAVAPATLGALYRDLTSDVGEAVHVINPLLQAQLRASFTAAGWDVKTNRSTRPNPPTIEETVTFLSECLAMVEGFAPAVDPTNEELADVSAACDRLWALDVGRLTPGTDYVIDLQEGKKPYEAGDCAPDALFSRVSEDVFRRPTFACFIQLLNNYERQVGKNETLSTAELQENSRFLDACLQTPCLQYVHKYLAAKEKAPAAVSAFKAKLHAAWFDMYGREHGMLDSSGFEHVFVGESKQGKISGLHNWLQLYLEEKAGRIDYRGYIRKRGQRRDADAPLNTSQLVTVQFAWDGELKDVSSSFVGVSPEFELALYSLLFFLGEERTTVKLGPYYAEITTFQYKQHGKVYIGSAFPGEPRN